MHAGLCVAGLVGREARVKAGRDCPLDYRLPWQWAAGEPILECEVLYIAGGLYGNAEALDALERRLAAEPGARAVLNGDAHWFDVDPQLFAAIETRLAAHMPLRGNVETELGRDLPGDAGCGCAYPDEVDDQTVDWSNAIHARLTATVAALPGMPGYLRGRDATALARVAGRRVAITHGDEHSLAGWQCSREALSDQRRQAELRLWSQQTGVSVLATSHTCAPAAWAEDGFAVINNGAAGMPNFNNGRYGLVTRIASTPHPSALYRATLDGLVVEALPLTYAHEPFLESFDRQWPAHSPAALSYRARMLNGTGEPPEAALLGGFSLGQTLCAMTTLE
jgi:hypothetical protein